MTDFDKLLAENTAPAPRANLANEILAAAEKHSPANDEAPRQKRWWAVGSLAAMAMISAFLVFQPGSSPLDAEAEHWELIADNSGFSDLYAWVEDDT